VPPLLYMSKRPLKYREFIKQLKPYGVIEIIPRGKGSERILLKPTIPGTMKGPFYPVKCHGLSTEIDVSVINAILRRFGIPKNEFWK
jgi:hypothetical protein